MNTHEVREHLIAIVARMTGRGASDVDVDAPVQSFGLDSVHAIDLITELEDRLGRELPDTLLWTYPTIHELSLFLGGEDAARPAPVAERADEPVAIIGMGCRFPGAAGKHAYWQLLVEGRDAVVPVPAQRWDGEALLAPVPGTPGRMTTGEGGFLDDVDLFDARFFGMTAAEAAATDPQQRLFLEVAWEALEDSGVPFGELDGSDTGVFVGVYANDYAQRLLGSVDAHFGTGTALSCVANRVSYQLGLCGPSLSVPTMCSSSLVALHLACESLRRGECSLAVAGGVNLVLEPHGSVWFSQIGAMSPSGRCRSYSAAADGMVRSDGAGAVVLKPLSRALADHDEIHAVVLGSAVRHNGRSNGLAAPSTPAQVAVVRSAWARADVDRVDYVEGHGTATPLGDRIEIDALRTVLDGRTCMLGTVKSQIGHTESAAGIAGVIKVALAMRHGVIPPNLHLDPPEPRLAQVGLRVPVAGEPWPKTGRGRLAGVSAFAIGGTDAHVVLESAPVGEADVAPAGPYTTAGTNARAVLEPAPVAPAAPCTVAAADAHAALESAPPASTGPYTAVISAATPSALAELAARYRKRIGELPPEDVGAACRMTRRRARLAHRAVATGPDAAALATALDRIARGEWDEASVLPEPDPGRRVEMPTYPFERTRHWIDR